jgi:hypothetical protein
MTFPLTTTLNRIAACDPCASGMNKGLAAAGKKKPDDEPISYAAILDAVGLNDALWCCIAEPQYAAEWRRYAVWCARQVQHLMDDERSIAALDVAESFANGNTSAVELAAAGEAARAAAREAARAAARAAAWEAAWEAARAAAGEAAGEAAGAKQAAAFRQLVTTGTLPPITTGTKLCP